MSSDSTPPVPHDPWAEHYESVMKHTFGGLYDRMTAYTMAEVERLAHTGATVLDLGAGTGRMVLPLARSGRRIIAVERSGPMVSQLRARLATLDPEDARRVEIRHASIVDAGSIEQVDLALCVFTVISYCLTEEELAETFATAAGALPPGGALLLDVPGAEVFISMDVESGDLIREVSMREGETGHYEYLEHTVIRTPDGPVEYRDSFRLRRWSPEEVERVLRRSGFMSIEDVSDRFTGLGARYLVARKGQVDVPAELS